MRKRSISAIVIAAAAVAASGVISGASASSASAVGGPDLSMSGSVVAGVRSVEASLNTRVALSFTMKNNSGTQSANDVAFYFTFTRTAGPDARFYECPLTSTHVAINPDTPSCEPGALAAGRSAQAAVIVAPRAGTTSMSVRACAQNLTGDTDPVPANNCKTLTVAVTP